MEELKDAGERLGAACAAAEEQVSARRPPIFAARESSRAERCCAGDARDGGGGDGGRRRTDRQALNIAANVWGIHNRPRLRAKGPRKQFFVVVATGFDGLGRGLPVACYEYDIYGIERAMRAGRPARLGQPEVRSRLRAMAVQASPVEIEAGSLSDEKLRSFVDGFDARGCTPPPPLLRLTPSS